MPKRLSELQIDKIVNGLEKRLDKEIKKQFRLLSKGTKLSEITLYINCFLKEEIVEKLGEKYSPFGADLTYGKKVFTLRNPNCLINNDITKRKYFLNLKNKEDRLYLKLKNTEDKQCELFN